MVIIYLLEYIIASANSPYSAAFPAADAQ